MDCIRWVLSPCACCCPCQEGREYLLRGRRAPLSVSTHDDDWDADLETDSKNKNRLSTNSAFTMNKELEVQMQRLSGNIPRSMQDVSVTDEYEEAGQTETGSGNGKGPGAWHGYKSSMLEVEDDGFSSESDKHSGQNSPVGGSQSQFNIRNDREPYRDVPYTDNAANGSNSINERATYSRQDPAALQAALLPPPPAGSGHPKAAVGISSPPGASTIEDDGDEDVEISLL